MNTEPNGGNVYRPHPLMITSGQFWRCKHGSTGFEKGLEWVGCEECKKDDPDTAKKWEEGE